ncbi:Ger(x)C family spore germination protein [Bacillus sp. FDAARGOS_1420]|uniref:Ger(x)C family spore germination protein n=2 Tax=Bacillus TaxID=1386 RepID=UPI001C5BF7AF|nr:Ger(x)C family spore germination protein [Bacillus sp. FDAARGOS_1420]MBW3496746.1 Ger(x)C family spore germination protein [Bacillus sp. FDAARGOS_1420]
MIRKIIYFLSCLILLTGCYDQIYVEDVAATLIVGIDLDKQNNLQIYVVNPLINKDQKRNEEKHYSSDTTVRKARDKFDTVDPGIISGSKIQIILLGKNLLKKKHWIRYLEPFYRDPQNTMTAKVIGVEGKVSDIIYSRSHKNNFLADYLTKLIRTGNARNVTVKTTFKELHRQVKDKGITPSISSIKKMENNKVKITGTMLLDSQNLFQSTLNPNENKLLTLLQGKVQGDYPFTINNPINKQWLSISAQRIEVDQKVSYTNRFIFNIQIDMGTEIIEEFPYSDTSMDGRELENAISKQLTKEITQLIKKFKQAKIDPIGLGLYARAFQYKNWVSHRQNWGNELSKSQINIKVNIKVRDVGSIK